MDFMDYYQTNGWEWLDPPREQNYDFMGIFDPSMYADARAFYQPWVFDALMEQEKETRQRRAIVASGQLIDELAHQIRT